MSGHHPWSDIKHKSDGGSSSYYNLPRNCKTLQDVIHRKEMSFTRGNIFKAAYRWDIKPNLLYNLRKMMWFAIDEYKRHDLAGAESFLKDLQEEIWYDLEKIR